jgi:hypothetical protein
MTPAAFRARLSALGLSLAQFAALTGLNRSTVSWWGKVRDGAVAEFPLWVERLLASYEHSGPGSGVPHVESKPRGRPRSALRK